MKKITKEDYNEIRFQFSLRVVEGRLPSLKQQTRSKKRRQFYKKFGKIYGVYEGTIRRVVKSKNYAEYLRLGRENRGTSTKRKQVVTTTISTGYMPVSVPSVWVTNKEPKPKKYKTTIISSNLPDLKLKSIEDDPGIISYTVEVLSD